MPKPRYTQIALSATPYYHCVSRCVRRAFLCGTDTVSGQTYEHRRGWIEEKLTRLVSVFAIDLCAYAIMSNHYHLVLHVNSDRAIKWTRDEVLHRWHQIFAGHALSLRYQRGEPLSKAELARLDKDVSVWQQRLMDISWFMRVLNESIARAANIEDHCTGRFWEGRFKSQALLDEAAILACMAYVDLNPLRAKLANTPEGSDHTSIKARIKKAKQATLPADPKQQPAHLYPLVGHPRKAMPAGIPFRLDDYLALVDWTGRILREDKRGAIAASLPPILERLNLEGKQWLYLAEHFESPFKGFVGSVYKLKQACQTLGYRRMPGRTACERCFS
ncbi:MAG: transposase [Gammaproteobacteria bacterium]|nr:transposase [Gammaproteobacteria bacterium]MDH5653430.1 transposase [Gammaproteobacteria bacterium]